MARPRSRTSTANLRAESVSGNTPQALAGSVSVYGRMKRNPQTDRYEIAKAWQHEAYRHAQICGEARYAATLFANIAGRAEIGVSEGQALQHKAVWVESGPEVSIFAEVAPTVRERTKLIRDFMLHWIIAGECYLIARARTEVDPEPAPGAAAEIWEIVGVTELSRVGEVWKVKYDNGNEIELAGDDPVIRIWNPDPSNRREAWSPFRSLLSTLQEIEWLTKHIFTQVRSRLASSGIWFVPNNITFPPPPPDAVEGGSDAIAMMNEAEQFMMSIAASSMEMLESDEVGFPTVVMADPAALEAVDQKKLIQFWSEIDDKAMILRSDAVRRFALGMDLPPEQVLGSSGLAVTGAGGSAGSVNHWGVWANEEQTISAHVEPALDAFVGAMTESVLRRAIPSTTKVIGYDTASLRLRQDRSKESIELFDRGALKMEVMLRENGYDPSTDMMTAEERREWLLMKIAGGSPLPEQIQGALAALGVNLTPTPASIEAPSAEKPKGNSGTTEPRNLDGHRTQGPPTVQHDHSDAPFSAFHASCEGLVLRALEKAGNRLLNDGKRGKDRDRTTPTHLAHLVATAETPFTADDFDFSTLSTVFGHLPALKRDLLQRRLGQFCTEMYDKNAPYSRGDLIDALRGL